MSMLLQVVDLCRGDVGRQRLNALNFNIEPGELVGVIGPNGAGKSTLLKTLIGFLNFSQGQVLLQGRAVTQLRAVERAARVSYLSQEHAEAFPFPVFEVVAMGLYARQGGISHATAMDQVDSVLERLELSALKSRKFNQLSGGEKQLIQFARLLVQDAPLMLLDEPTANLDIGHEFQLMNCLREDCDSGKSAMVAIHNLNTAAEFCDRLILINEGEIVTDGAPEKVITQAMINDLYSDRAFVACNPHSGAVNVLPVRQHKKDRNITVHIIGGAGSAVELSRQLLRLGCSLTGGIAHHQDTDASFWRSQSVPFVEVTAFETISQDMVEKTAPWVEEADLTILCDFPIGPANQANLALASRAGNLLVVQSDTATSRFFNPASEQAFEQLFKEGIAGKRVQKVLGINEVIALIRSQLEAVQ